MNRSPIVKKIAAISGILILGIILGWLLFGGSSGQSETTDMAQHVEEAHTDEQGNIVYTCSMHPASARTNRATARSAAWS
ncbi:MAG: hypothetical protein U5K69_01110 [Balneolaceae bacterium]|nr:hypothetical protein [Balneolaceae bacterium]